MNCSRCKSLIGNDAFHTGELEPVLNGMEEIIDYKRATVLHCAHCGTFELTQDRDDNIITFEQITDTQLLALCEARIPACRLDRKVSA